MGKYELNILTKNYLEYFYKIKSLEYGTSIDDVKIKIRNRILSELYKSDKLRDKIDGMVYRNRIPKTSNITDDILNSLFLELCKYDIDILFTTYCDNPDRILALSVTIASRIGFSKLNKDVSPNQSVAKQILFASNIDKRDHLSTTEDTYYFNDHTHTLRSKVLFDLPTHLIDNKNIWDIIIAELSDDENEFLDFILKKVFSKKYQTTYSMDLRKKYYTYNEYKIRLLELSSRIKDILKKNDLNI